MYYQRRTLRMTCALLVMAMVTIEAAKGADGVSWKKEERRVTAYINWCAVEALGSCLEEAQGTSPQTPRVDSDTVVTVRVYNFNFLRYDVAYTVDERLIESYAFLAGLWDQILGFELPALAPANAEDLTPIDEWWGAIQQGRTMLSTTLSRMPSSIGLKATDIENIREARDQELKFVSTLEGLRSAAFAFATTATAIQRFSIVDQDHKSLVDAIKAFSERAERCIAGDQHLVGRKNAGTYITVSIAPVALASDSSPAAIKTVSTEYLVESTAPLIFHSGLTYSSLKDAKFETIRTLGDRDLFAKIRDEDGTESFSVYLSHPFGNMPAEQAQWLATIGTDLSNVGENIYIGVSLRVWSRFLLSAGGVYGLEKQAEGAVEEEVEPGEGARTLYEIVKEDRRWGFFAGFSVKIY